MNSIIFILLSIFSMSFNPFHSADPEDEAERLSNKITAQVAAESKRELGLVPCGFGGRIRGKIEKLNLSFNCYKPLSLEDGRELLITSVDRYISALNSDQKIRLHLSNYPFEPKNIELEIFIKNKNGSSIRDGNLCVIITNQGILEYITRDSATDRLREIYRETYEEAVEKIAQKHISEKQAVEVDLIPQK